MAGFLPPRTLWGPLAGGRNAVARALAQGIDGSGGEHIAGPVLAVVPLPDARLLNLRSLYEDHVNES